MLLKHSLQTVLFPIANPNFFTDCHLIASKHNIYKPERQLEASLLPFTERQIDWLSKA